MRIAYLHYLYGREGGAKHVRQFADAARGLGHDVRVHGLNLAPDDDAAPGGLRQRARRALKARCARWLHEPKELVWNARYAVRELALVRALRPDVLLVRDHHLTFAEALVARRSGVPLVLEVNAPAAESTLYFAQYAHVPLAAEVTQAWKLRAADAVVVVSAALRTHLLARHRVAPERVVVSHNGADPERFHPDVDGSDVRARHRLGDAVVVGFVGHVKPWHGAPLLRQLMQRLAGPALRFLVVGGGDGYETLRAWAAGRPAREHLVFAGTAPHDAVPAHLAAIDIALVPDSNFYGSSLKLLEYMAMGRAIVAPAYAPIAEVARDGREALLFPPGDAAAAARCIEQLARDPARRRALGAAARQRVLDDFTWRHNAERVLAACDRALAARAPAGWRPARAPGAPG